MSDPHPRRMMSQATHVAATSRAATTTSAPPCSSVFTPLRLSGGLAHRVGRHRAVSGRHRRASGRTTSALPVATTILAAGWLALVGAPATHGGDAFNPGATFVRKTLSSHGEEPVDNAVIGGGHSATRGTPRQVVMAAAVTPQRVPPLIGARGLTPNAVALAAYIQQRYPEVASIGGVRPDPIPDHPTGHALDVMVYGDTALGDQIEADVMAQADRFHVRYSIYRETYHNPSGRTYWMADRGSPTQNHFDHIHFTVY